MKFTNPAETIAKLQVKLDKAVECLKIVSRSGCICWEIAEEALKQILKD